MRGFLARDVIVSPWVFLIILLFVVIGYAVVHVIANRKWGYTPKREKELQKEEN
ncbi:MAG: hypothetical protein HFH73_09995 [Lachnospiraceae bacterium]|nr:hypothetical protein [Lachnospiraceae bacterium]